MLNKKMTIDEFPERTVRDFWKAIKVSSVVLFSSFMFFSLVVPGLLTYVTKDKIEQNLGGVMFIIYGVPIILSIISYITYIRGVKLKDGYFSWPASDVENNFLDLITLKRLRGVFYREKIPVKEIEYVTNDFGWNGDKGSSKRIFNLNIAGAFGSRNIRFNSKQKRDEARNILRSFSKTVMSADIAFN